MSTRRSAIQKTVAMEDPNDAPPILEREIKEEPIDFDKPVLEREVKEEIIDSDELQDSDVSKNRMSQHMGHLNGSGLDEDANDPFPRDFGVNNIAPRAAQATLYGTSRNSRGAVKAQRIQSATTYGPDRRYTLGPAKPKPPRGNQKFNVVGTNTNPGPRRILAEREKELKGHPYKNMSTLKLYNEGRLGEQFKPMLESEISGFFDRMTSISSAKRGPTKDVQKMLQEQPSVRMEVKMGVGALEQEEKKNPEGMPKKLTLRQAKSLKKAQIEKEDELKIPKEESVSKSPTPATKVDQPNNLPAQIRKVADQLESEPSTQDVLMSSMVMNALKNLKARNNGDHAQFSTEIFGLLVKYGIE